MHYTFSCRAMIGIFVVLVIVGTLCDLFCASRIRELPQPASLTAINVFKCFSLYSNGKKLLSTKKMDGSIDCIHGIKFLSMCWVVLVHTYLKSLEGFSPMSPFRQKNIFEILDVSLF